MDLYPTAENPLPPGAECLELRTRDGIRLRAMYAVPRGARGTVVVVGGRGDFIERYFETMRDLMARGFAVASVDLRGQGGSQRLSKSPYRGPVRSFAGFDEDIATLIDGVVHRLCPPPYFALGHSTGGHVLLRLLRTHGWFRKVVLVAPLVQINYGPWPEPVVATLMAASRLLPIDSMFLPGVNKRPMGHDDFPGNPLTSDEWRWHRDSATLDAAPHLGLGGATFSWLRAARASLAAVMRMRMPMAPALIVAAGSDRVVGNEGIRELARKVPGIALAVIPNAQHEILSERDEIRRQFFAAFDSFIGPPTP
jgi:lysophospholipase